jgi:WD40 repeat protein
VWELDSGEQVLTIRSQAEGNPDGHENAVFQIAISPDAKLAASASWDGTVRLWDMATGKVVGVLEGHTNDVYAVAFSPDGRTLASAGSDIRLWHVETGRPIGTLPNQLAPILNLDFSPDGSVLAAGSRNEPNRIQLFRAPRTNAGP